MNSRQPFHSGSSPLSSIDDIVFTTEAKKWHAKHDLMPSAWRLDETELTRIRNSGVAISTFNSPACTIPLDDVSVLVSPLRHIVISDSKRIDRWMAEGLFLRDEVIATLLHEIGHVVNRLPVRYWSESEEFWADDYARHCGFGDALLTGLGKLIVLERGDFDKPNTHDRIARIAAEEPVRLAWDATTHPSTHNVRYPTSF